MDFGITDDQRALQDLAREILLDATTHERLQALESRGWAVFDGDLWRRLADAGITGIAIPEQYGGGGLGFLELALVFEEVGRTVAPVPAVPTLATSYVLAAHGPLPVAARVLPGVVTGDTVVTAALEDSTGVAARWVGDRWVLEGEKPFVPYGAIADLVLVPAMSDTGPVVALVRRGSRGLAITELETTNREPQALLTFEAAPVAGDDVITDAGDLVRQLTRHVTAGLCSVAAGLCDAALTMTAKHTAQREQFGKPIASFQAVGQRAADAYIDEQMVRLTALQAAWRLSVGWPADEEIAVAKFWAGDGGMRVVHACQHLHGGLGVDLDYPLHRYFLWCKQIEHELGTPTRQLLELGAQLAASPV